MARVLMHIPEPRRRLVRYYGWYANAARRKRKLLEHHPVGGGATALAASKTSDKEQSPDARAHRRRWAEMIKRVYEGDPLVCPRCQGEMRIIAFVVDPTVVDKILGHLRTKGEHRERGPPGWGDLEAAS